MTTVRREDGWREDECVTVHEAQENSRGKGWTTERGYVCSIQKSEVTPSVAQHPLELSLCLSATCLIPLHGHSQSSILCFSLIISQFLLPPSLSTLLFDHSLHCFVTLAVNLGIQPLFFVSALVLLLLVLLPTI